MKKFLLLLLAAVTQNEFPAGVAAAETTPAEGARSNAPEFPSESIPGSRYGPGSYDIDAAIHKTFQLREAHGLTFRFEMFNALNHMNPGSPTASVADVNFGRILNGSGGRNIRFGLKYAF